MLQTSVKKPWYDIGVEQTYFPDYSFIINDQSRYHKIKEYFKMYVQDFIDLDDGCYSVRLQFSDSVNYKFLAGQYLFFQYSHQYWREYSIASFPYDKYIELLIKANKDNENIDFIKSKFYSKQPVYISNAAGKTTFDEDLNHYVCIVNGVGVSPVKSLLSYFNHRQYSGKILDVYWMLDRCDTKLVQTISDECDSDSVRLNLLPFSKRHDNHWNVNMLFEAMKNNSLNSENQYLLFGSPGFVKSISKRLRECHCLNVTSDFE